MDGKTGVGARIRRARRDADLTQTALAGQLGVDQKRIVEWEKGQHAPGTDALRKLAAALRTTVQALLGDEPPIAAPDIGPDTRQIALDALELSGRLNAFAQSLLAAQGQPARSETPPGAISLRRAREGKGK